jgi:hypothetical protein
MHIFALHYVLLPRINRNLEMFQEAYNSAPLSTESGNSPTQLWTRGLLNVKNSNRRVAQEFCDVEVWCTHILYNDTHLHINHIIIEY